jgi:succinoglycan biosynthesis protein ExoO
LPITSKTDHGAAAGSRPLVSVIMANRDGGRYLGAAIDSVLAQSLDDLELIVVDDASADDSVAIMQGAAARDSRVTPIRLTENGGPAGARNAALAVARGHWIAIVDSDDLIHPERLDRLLAAAARTGADVVADDLMHFFDDGAPVRFLLGPRYREPFFVSAGDLIRSGTGRAPTLGYLKPIIRADLLGDLRYDEAVRIGEDQDLLLRILLKDANFWVVPTPWYLYRRHSGSISHRLSPDEVTRMIASQRRLLAMEGSRHPEIVWPLKYRVRRLEKALAFTRLVADAKRGAWGAAAGALLRQPRLAVPLAVSAGQHFRKTAAAGPAAYLPWPAGPLLPEGGKAILAGSVAE